MIKKILKKQPRKKTWKDESWKDAKASEQDSETKAVNLKHEDLRRRDFFMLKSTSLRLPTKLDLDFIIVNKNKHSEYLKSFKEESSRRSSSQ